MRRALVTGGANGIGAAIARRLVRDGNHVVILDRDEDALRRIAGVDGIATLSCDLAALDRIGAALAPSGHFDILVNNAGIDQHGFFTQSTPEEWRRLMAVNLEAVLAVTHTVLPAMREARWGRIVNIASEAGRLGSRGGAVYAAAKGGVIAFTRSIAREVGDCGITANVVAPGPIDTPLLRAAVARVGPKLLEAMRSATLVGRLGTPEDVAAAVSFLASDEAGFVTGEVLGVSGGMGCGA